VSHTDPEAAGGVLSAEFPVPADKVVLFDIDGTLIDTSYDVTDEYIYPAIQEARDAGWIVGLSSDTPHATMAERAQQFGIGDGPLIAEKSGLVTYGDWAVEPIPGVGEAFRASQSRITKYLTDQGVVVWSGNPAVCCTNGLASLGTLWRSLMTAANIA
jgi:hydroxymethylpyrimidine pyrophosphatase-like HAD family hydrolase